MVKILILWSIIYWDFISKSTFKSTEIKKVYTYLKSKNINTVLLGIFFLIASFILLCLLLLSTPVANFIKTLIKKSIIIGILPRRYRTDRQDIMDNVKTKAQDRQIVYNLSESKRT